MRNGADGRATARAWAGYIRALLYPVIFETNPVDGLDRVIEVVVDRGPVGTPDDFLGAVAAALASTDDLSALLPQDHSDQEIREFLRELAQRLVAGRQ
jgi:hypothetical protein